MALWLTVGLPALWLIVGLSASGALCVSGLRSLGSLRMGTGGIGVRPRWWYWGAVLLVGLRPLWASRVRQLLGIGLRVVVLVPVLA